MNWFRNNIALCLRWFRKKREIKLGEVFNSRLRGVDANTHQETLKDVEMAFQHLKSGFLVFS